MEKIIQRRLIEHVRTDVLCTTITKGFWYIMHCIETNSGYCKCCGKYLHCTTFHWEEFKKRCATDEAYTMNIYYHMTATCT